MTLTFATLAIRRKWENETLLLVESLRTFGGKLAHQPILILTLKDKPLTQKSTKKLDQWQVEWTEFEMDQQAQQFPLALVVHGAAAAENALHGSANLIVWLLPDTLILNEPASFLLQPKKRLGYRPVHHQNIGSSFDHSPDEFWQYIYQHCEVPEKRIFRMETCYREAVRPYVNAGILVSRPKDGLMKDWLHVFERTYQHPEFIPFYTQRKYAIFMHQAVLAGVILQKFTQEGLKELPESYNYPLHLHPKYPPDSRAKTLHQLVTVRYENTRRLPGFLEKLPTDPKLSEWFKLHNLLR